jgi:hypothetical protein
MIRQLTYYLMENHRSLQLYDQTIFEAVIVLFDLKYFIKNVVACNSFILKGNPLTLYMLAYYPMKISILLLWAVIVWYLDI